MRYFTVQVLQKNRVVLVWPGAAHALIAVYVGPQVYSVEPTTIDVCKNLSRSVEIWQYKGFYCNDSLDLGTFLSKNRARRLGRQYIK